MGMPCQILRRAYHSAVFVATEYLVRLGQANACFAGSAHTIVVKPWSLLQVLYAVW